MERVGVIGLGQMGEGIATNLVNSGFETSVFDVRPEPVDRLQALGATVTKSYAEIAQFSDVVHVVVFDDAQTIDVCDGSPDAPGLLAKLESGSLVILHSTIQPATVQALAQRGAERGVHVIDAAMTGGSGPAAMAGQLTLMVGAPTELVERCRPMFDAIAERVFHVGALGQGVTAKIVNNLVLEMYVMVVRDGLQLASGAGIDESTMLEILNDGGTGWSYPSKNWENIRGFEATHPQGPLGLVDMTKKDLSLAVALADALGCQLAPARAVVSDVLPNLSSGLTR